jgi:hypothetical protein
MTSASTGLWLAVVSGSLADAPTQSIRPDIRPGTLPLTQAVLAPSAPVTERKTETLEAVAVSPRPEGRPKNFAAIVRAALQRPKAETPAKFTKRGSVCGDKSIRGQQIASIPGKLKGCGVQNPVRITEVDGVRLSMAATVNCTTAKALKKWVSQTVKPSVGRMGGGVTSLRVAAHYSCRSRNNIPGAKISEHGRGNAIDISAITLKNGTSLTVISGWRDKKQGPVLKKIHRGACGTFGTVLGPNSDPHHQDHFHLDVANHRSGAYCK